MVESLIHPNVRWAQQKGAISMVVDLQDVTDYSMTLSPEGLFSFECTVNEVHYGYSVSFYKEVDVQSAKMHYNKRNFSIIIEKKEKEGEKWPRLRSTAGKHLSYSVDWDRWEESDGEEDNEPKDWNTGKHHPIDEE